MNLKKKDLLYSGKAKSLFTTDNADWLIVEFRDDTTAFDGGKREALADKGAVNNQISAYIMQILEKEGVLTHYKERISPYQSLVRRLKMIPLESVIRNVAAGSICRRLGVQVGKTFNPPLYELFWKNDELHDPLVNENHVVCFEWATQNQLDQMEQITFKINKVLTELFAKAGLILVDSKYEFGVSSDGNIYLGDEISPDSCRVWDEKTYESLDKDRFRKDLGNVVSSYQRIAELLGISIEF